MILNGNAYDKINWTWWFTESPQGSYLTAFSHWGSVDYPKEHVFTLINKFEPYAFDSNNTVTCIHVKRRSWSDCVKCASFVHLFQKCLFLIFGGIIHFQGRQLYLNWFVPYLNGVCTIRKEFAPRGSKFFRCSVDTFSEGP